MKLAGLLLFSIFLFIQDGLEKITLLDNKVEILSPHELSNMTDEMWAFKYKKRVRPVLVLTDTNGTVNLLADMTMQGATEEQLAAFKDLQIGQLKKSRPDLEFVGDGIKIVNGKKVGYFKFLSQAIDQKIFNYFFFTIVNNKVLLFNFNCIEKLRGSWEKTAETIVESIVIK
jgi:hypothetical protein